MGATLFELHFFFGFHFFDFVIALSLYMFFYASCSSWRLVVVGRRGPATYGGGVFLVLSPEPLGGGRRCRGRHTQCVGPPYISFFSISLILCMYLCYFSFKYNMLVFFFFVFPNMYLMFLYEQLTLCFFFFVFSNLYFMFFM